MNTNLINETRQYLTFKLDEEIFGVDVSQVREILDLIKITKVPQTPDFMCGVINLRGSVVPIVDMRLKFGLPKKEATVNTCIIVVEVLMDGDVMVLGALVDSVQEVFELEPKDIEPAPKMGTRLNTQYIKGMGRREENFIIILDTDKIFSAEEISIVQNAQNENGN